MQSDSNQLGKTMQNRHLTVSQFTEHRLSSNKKQSSDSTGLNESHPEINTSEGYLFKRTSKGFKTWNRRWFYLRDNQLQYVYVLKREYWSFNTLLNNQ